MFTIIQFRRTLVLILIFIINCPLLAQVKKPIDILIEKSDVIVIGKVNRISSRWNEDKTKILSDIEINVFEALKGKERKNIIVTKPGGEIGSIGIKVFPSPEFKKNEKALLFLRRIKDDNYVVMQMEKGKFTIKNDHIVDYLKNTHPLGLITYIKGKILLK